MIDEVLPRGTGTSGVTLGAGTAFGDDVRPRRKVPLDPRASE